MGRDAHSAENESGSHLMIVQAREEKLESEVSSSCQLKEIRWHRCSHGANFDEADHLARLESPSDLRREQRIITTTISHHT